MLSTARVKLVLLAAMVVLCAGGASAAAAVEPQGSKRPVGG